MGSHSADTLSFPCRSNVIVSFVLRQRFSLAQVNTYDLKVTRYELLLSQPFRSRQTAVTSS